MTGPPSTSAPVAMSKAWTRWKYVEPFLDMATAYRIPCAPAARSITGVEVMPISGVTWPHPRSSLVVSPDPSSETFQSCAPVSASNA